MLKQQTINESDLFGLSTIDAVLRGGDCFYQAEFKEYRAGSLSCFTKPFTGTIGQLYSAANPIGRLATAAGAALVLTAVANTPAAATPASLTAAVALLAENYDVRLLFDSQLRPVPIRMQLFPQDSAGTGTWFSTT